jgi:hypothetical protein
MPGCAVFTDAQLGLVARIATTTAESTAAVLLVCEPAQAVGQFGSLRPANASELPMCAVAAPVVGSAWPCWVLATPSMCVYQPCLHSCSGHGACSNRGQCACAPDWAGIACDQNATVSGCAAGACKRSGSARAAHMDAPLRHAGTMGVEDAHDHGPYGPAEQLGETIARAVLVNKCAPLRAGTACAVHAAGWLPRRRTVHQQPLHLP